jgi:uncharacterized protein (UPF0276 family)
MLTTHPFGLGLRKAHYGDFLDHEAPVPVDFVEVISENFMVEGGRPRDILRRVRARHPVALHGVSMSIGSVDGLDPDYLHRLRALADDIEPLFVSDHLSWSRIEGFNSHDLLPLPYTEEALGVVCANIGHAQDALGRTMLIENPSSYIAFAGDMTEWEFLDAMCARTGCRVRQIHLAGHSQGRDLLIDTHDRPVPASVWSLYEATLRYVGPVATMIERDDDIPPLAELLDELDMARSIAATRIRRAA